MLNTDLIDIQKHLVLTYFIFPQEMKIEKKIIIELATDKKNWNNFIFCITISIIT